MKGNKLCFTTIIRRNLQVEKYEDESEIANALLLLTHIRLDRENIDAIENLECLGSVTNLYLQQNMIETIQNLECLSSSLRFLTLAGNNISRIQGLISLHVLAFLDLSDNNILKVNIEELPKSLVFIKFQKNNCTCHPNYRKELIDYLPQLKEIDDTPIEFIDSSSSSDEDLDEIQVENEKVNLDGQDVYTDLLLKSSLRLDDLVVQHRQRVKEIEDVKQSMERCRRTPADLSNLLTENSEFSDVKQNMQCMLQKMINAEHLAMTELNKLSLKRSDLAEQFKETASKDIANDRLAKMPNKTQSEQRSVSAKASGLSNNTSTTIISKSLKTSRMNTSANVSRVYNQKSTNRLERKKSEPLVRIPGARPFHRF